MNQKYKVVIQPVAQKAIEDAYFWVGNCRAKLERG